MKKSFLLFCVLLFSALNTFSAKLIYKGELNLSKQQSIKIPTRNYSKIRIVTVYKNKTSTNPDCISVSFLESNEKINVDVLKYNDNKILEILPEFVLFEPLDLVSLENKKPSSEIVKIFVWGVL